MYVDTVGDAALYQERLAKRYPGIRHARPRCSRLHVHMVCCKRTCQAIMRMALLIEWSKHWGPCSFMVCPKADSLYPIVSAASIVAKVCAWSPRLLLDAGHGKLLLSFSQATFEGGRYAHALQTRQCLGVEICVHALP